MIGPSRLYPVTYRPVCRIRKQPCGWWRVDGLFAGHEFRTFAEAIRFAMTGKK